MEAIDRLKILSSQMDLEPTDECNRASLSGQPNFSVLTRDLHVGTAEMFGGKRILLLKTLLTSACERDCLYCPFRAGRDFRRATFKPEEFANLFNGLALAKKLMEYFSAAA